MATKRKDEESSKPDSTNDSTAKVATKTEESSSKKAKYTKEDPGMTSQQFSASAKEITISIGDDGKLGTLTAEPTSGSYGWKANSKLRITVVVDGEEKEVQAMVGVNFTVAGSKPDVKKVTNGKRGRPRKNPIPESLED